MKDLKNKFGSWAIVTGASSGIGKEFARQLASNGINLILFARRENLLEELSNQLKNDYKIQVRYKKLDLTEQEFVSTIEDVLKDIDVRLLISNAGAAHMGAFSKIAIEDLQSMVSLNVTAQLKISHWFTSRLIQEKKQGGLLLVSSSIAYQGTPYAANYSAGKAYILNLGEALNFEMKEHNINVSVLVPGPTDAPGLTERTDSNMKDNLPMKPQAVDELVKEGLAALLKNKPYQLGGKMNRMMTGMMGLMMSRAKASVFWGKKMKEMVYLT
ncbi:MAG: SDR family NAD(P)-dependent oxidoreductase [Bacteroidota bacterium]